MAAALELDRLCIVVPGDFLKIFPSKSLGSQVLPDLCSSSFLLYLKEGPSLLPQVGATPILVGQGSPTSEYSDRSWAGGGVELPSAVKGYTERMSLGSSGHWVVVEALGS